ncbi:MAG: hypothetical protein CEN89_289 [Candidatus Berkelbacteria bacterium Licking1014_7]|uniref:Uncharacterized protein n=1 Tax=Candidatus Berkelbacteria bacterium Licking1014_7 TaxID=2017147 RepID=A0A554LK74_9BACT|nr:MAG: hypothetical protein CEN89_289 [Candidatus Berkelbacteria bacterium Licking1014_7]
MIYITLNYEIQGILNSRIYSRNIRPTAMTKKCHLSIFNLPAKNTQKNTQKYTILQTCNFQNLTYPYLQTGLTSLQV